MQFEVRPEPIESVYQAYVDWCTVRDFPYRKMCELGTAFVCYREKDPLYICFLWTTNSTFAVLGFPIANPHIPYQRRIGGLTYLFNEMGEIAREAGCTILWTTSSTHKVEESLKEAGYEPADLKVTQYVKVLN